MSQQIRLGDLLLRANVVNEQQLSQALHEQKQWGGRLGTTLVRMGIVTEELLVLALSRQLNMPRAALGPSDPINVPAQLLERVDRGLCERHMFLPVAWIAERRAVQVAVADPFNVVVLDDLGRRLGLRIETLIAGETQIAQAIARVYGGADVDVSGRSSEGMPFLDNSGAALGSRPPTRPTMQGVGAPESPTRPPSPKFSRPPSSTSMLGVGTAPAAAPLPATTGTTIPPASHGPEELRAAAEQQRRATRALVELLVERGVLDPSVLQRARV
jgi:hypothetical protein